MRNLILLLSACFVACSSSGRQNGPNGSSTDSTKPQVNLGAGAGSDLLTIPFDLKTFRGATGINYKYIVADGDDLVIVHDRGASQSHDGGRTFSPLVLPVKISDLRVPTISNGRLLFIGETSQPTSGTTSAYHVYELSADGQLTAFAQSWFWPWNNDVVCGDSTTTCSDDNFRTTFPIPKDAVSEHHVLVRRFDRVLQEISPEGFLTLNRRTQTWELKKVTWPQEIAANLGSFIQVYQRSDNWFEFKFFDGSVMLSKDFKSWNKSVSSHVGLDPGNPVLLVGGTPMERSFIDPADERYDSASIIGYDQSGHRTLDIHGVDFFANPNGDLLVVKGRSVKGNHLPQELVVVKKGSTEEVSLSRPSSAYLGTSTELAVNDQGTLLAVTPVGLLISTDGGLSARVLDQELDSSRVRRFKALPYQNGFIVLVWSYIHGEQILLVTPEKITELDWDSMNATNGPLDLINSNGEFYALGNAGFFTLSGSKWIPTLFPNRSLIHDGRLFLRSNHFFVLTADKQIEFNDCAAPVATTSTVFSYANLYDFGPQGLFATMATSSTHGTNVYASLDRGQTWSLVNETYGDIDLKLYEGAVYVIAKGFMKFNPSKRTFERLASQTDCSSSPSAVKPWLCTKDAYNGPFKANSGTYFIDLDKQQLQFVRDFQ